MTMPLQEISDRLEIQDLLTRYSYAVDDRDWDAYRRVFTADAVIDYTAFGGPRGGVEDMVAYLPKALTRILSGQHVITNTLIELDGDSARVRTVCQCPMVLDLGEGRSQVFFQGLWYRDRLSRTLDGWRIAERIEEKSYTHNVPEDFAF